MEEAAAVRQAAVETVRDVVPDPLQDRIVGFIDDGSMIPGTVTVLAAESFGGDEAAVDGLLERAVGVQLIYDGLRLTRELVHGDPWARGEKSDADMGILAADVMVARGFYLLARSDSAECAVEVVRAFGRDQTEYRERGESSLDSHLERDVLELAVLAGATAVGVSLSKADIATFATGRVDGVGYPPVDGSIAGGLRADLRALADGHVEETAARSD